VAHWESKVSSTRHRKDSCFLTSRARVKGGTPHRKALLGIIGPQGMVGVYIDNTKAKLNPKYHDRANPAYPAKKKLILSGVPPGGGWRRKHDWGLGPGGLAT